MQKIGIDISISDLTVDIFLFLDILTEPHSHFLDCVTLLLMVSSHDTTRGALIKTLENTAAKYKLHISRCDGSWLAASLLKAKFAQNSDQQTKNNKKKANLVAGEDNDDNGDNDDNDDFDLEE
jgi:hypothetical protein